MAVLCFSPYGFLVKAKQKKNTNKDRVTCHLSAHRLLGEKE